jgi:hypothetical protein
MKYFKKLPERKLGDNTTPAWQAIAKLFQVKKVKVNENFSGIERTINEAKIDYDSARREIFSKPADKRPLLDTIQDLM